MRMNERKACGTCLYNTRRKKYNGKGYEFACGCTHSEYEGIATFYDDYCDEWESKGRR